MAEQLLNPLKLGNITLSHRVIMAPCTRYRATDDHIPGPHAKTYYAQRASVPGTLIITEATYVSEAAAGQPNVPGLWNAEQVKAWKEVTDAVHAKGSFIFVQLWALGRAAGLKPHARHLHTLGHEVLAPSPVGIDDQHEVPKAMSEDEIESFIQAFGDAARNAMAAGFDGVEVHGGSGYLVDQFIQDMTNIRTDKWGGSIQNRSRFILEVTKRLIKATGDPKRVALRFSPWATGRNMRMADPIPQFSRIITEAKSLGVAYLHLIEARTRGTSGADAVYRDLTRENDPFVELWCADGHIAPLILSGGYDQVKAAKMLGETYAEHENLAVSFGRLFISTPDLPFRFAKGIEHNPLIGRRSMLRTSTLGTLIILLAKSGWVIAGVLAAAIVADNVGPFSHATVVGFRKEDAVDIIHLHCVSNPCKRSIFVPVVRIHCTALC